MMISRLACFCAGVLTAMPLVASAAPTTVIPLANGGQRRVTRYRTAGLRVASVVDEHPNGQVTRRSLFSSRISRASTLVVTELGPGRPEQRVVTHHSGSGGSIQGTYEVDEKIPAHMMPDQPPPPFPGKR